MMYYVYVLKSVNFNRNYIGFSRDIYSRLSQHNKGGTKSTKPYRPWKILFFETIDTIEEALQRERFLKTGKGRE